MKGTLTERFWRKVAKDGPVHPVLGTACWDWPERRGLSYGMLSAPGGPVLAHRLSWELANGPIPLLPSGKTAHVLHRCDRPRCVNPDHLFIGGPVENAADRHAKGREASGERHGSRTMPERVARGERLPQAKLTAANVSEIRQRVADGEDRKKVAAAFGIHEMSVGRIVRRKSWAHVQ